MQSNPLIFLITAVLDEEEEDAPFKAIFLAAMEAEGVKVGDIALERPFTSPKDVKKSRRYFMKKGFAWFTCPSGDKTWPSAHAWCIVDLKEGKICYRYKQGCQKCESMASPEFTKEYVEWVAELAVKSFLRRTGQLNDLPDTGADGPVGGGPHDEERCEMCRELGHSCWK